MYQPLRFLYVTCDGIDLLNCHNVWHHYHPTKTSWIRLMRLVHSYNRPTGIQTQGLYIYFLLPDRKIRQKTDHLC